MRADPKNAQKFDNLTVFFVLLGSARVKAARKTLMKLTPDWWYDQPVLWSEKNKQARSLLVFSLFWCKTPPLPLFHTYTYTHTHTHTHTLKLLAHLLFLLDTHLLAHTLSHPVTYTLSLSLAHSHTNTSHTFTPTVSLKDTQTLWHSLSLNHPFVPPHTHKHIASLSFSHTQSLKLLCHIKTHTHIFFVVRTLNHVKHA